ncbi:MAG TPA: response regulator [Saprospiraceae bacterium]|nr:response regulator [Saprospiraceae bacterium]
MKNKILIIEDNHDVRENLSEILLLSGYDTITAANGKEGVQAAMNESPDLILCDDMISELDGFGVLRILSKNPTTNSIPFIFLTAKTEMSDMRRGMTLGADDYITKPFDDVELLDTIDIRLQKKKSMSHTDASVAMFNILTGEQVMKSLPENFMEGEVRSVHKKDLLFSEGQTCRNVYIMKSGKAVGTKVDDYSKEVITRLYQYPDVIGLSSALTGQRFQETVKAFEDLEVMPVKKEDFIQFILNDKSISYYFLNTIAKDQVKADEKLLMQAYSTVRSKLAAVLIDLYKAYEADGKAIIPIPREDLASMAGTAKETIIRSLSEFKDEGLVTITGTEITIDNINKLVDLRY